MELLSPHYLALVRHVLSLKVWSAAIYVPALINCLEDIRSALSLAETQMCDDIQNKEEWGESMNVISTQCNLATVRKHAAEISEKVFKGVRLEEGWLASKTPGSKVGAL